MKKYTRDNDLAALIYGKYESWKQATQERRLRWEKTLRHMRCVEDPGDRSRTSERSTIKIPATKMAADTAFDNLYEILFSREPWFQIKGRTFNDELKALLVQNYLEYLLHREGFPSKFEVFLWEYVAFGTAVGQINLHTDLEQRVTMEPTVQTMVVMDEFGNETLQEQEGPPEAVSEERTIIRPQFQPISVVDFFIDPYARRIDDADGCVVRSFKRVPDLKRLERMGVVKNVGQVVDSIAAEKKSDDDDDFRYRMQMIGVNPDFNKQDRKMVLQYWGWVDAGDLKGTSFNGEIEDGGAEVFAIACNGVLMKLVPNPHVTRKRPFIHATFEPTPDFYSIGIGDVADGPQRALDATIRSRLDNKALAINTMFGINVRKLVKGQDLSLYPGKKWLIDGDVREAIQQFQVNDVTGGSYLEAAELERYIQEATRMSRMLGGQPVKRGEMSATESSILGQQQSVSVKRLIKTIENTAIEPILRWYWQIAIQYLDVPELIKVTDGQGMEQLMQINPEDLAGDFDFIPQGTLSINQDNQLQKTLQFMQIASSNPVVSQMVNQEALIRRVYRLLGFDDEDQIIQMPQGQAQMMAQQMPQQGSPPASRQQSPQPGAVQ